MGPTTATAAEPVLFLQPTSARAQEPETSWASAGAFCAGAAVAAGAVALAAAQPKSKVRTPTRSEQRAALRAARHAAAEMKVTPDEEAAAGPQAMLAVMPQEAPLKETLRSDLENELNTERFSRFRKFQGIIFESLEENSANTSTFT